MNQKPMRYGLSDHNNPYFIEFFRLMSLRSPDALTEMVGRLREDSEVGADTVSVPNADLQLVDAILSAAIAYTDSLDIQPGEALDPQLVELISSLKECRTTN